MKRIILPLLLLVSASLLGSGYIKADDTKAPYKNAGNFEVEVVKNIAYYEGEDADAVRHRLDLYFPKGQKKFPVLMFVHGGAWKMGSKDLYEKLGQLYAKNGIGTVIINYRLSPKVKHPGHIEDVARAFAWINKNIAKHGGDPDNVFVSGHSAGGHLVALLSSNETYLKAQGLGLSNIKGTIGLSGVYVVVPSLMFKDIFTDDKDTVKSASPIEHVSAKQPPCLLLYADKDYMTLDMMAEQMCKKMKECKCEVSTLKIADRTHISIITSMANESDPANQAIFEFLAKYGGVKLKDAGK
jgi:acetyl esterase/lipase